MQNITLTRQQIEILLRAIEHAADANGSYSRTQLETKQILKEALKTVTA